MYITANQLEELRVSKKLLERKLAKGEWIMRNPSPDDDNRTELAVLISSLPKKLQLKWAQKNSSLEYPEQIAVLLSEAAKYGIKEQEAEINRLLLPLMPLERRSWIAEALRLARIIERYNQIKPKRRRTYSGAWEFVPEVSELLQETVCKDPLILARHPIERDHYQSTD